MTDVLIVEDNPDGRESLRHVLTLLGLAVKVAADGVEGVRLGLELRPRAAVVDIGLPGLSGFAVARELRRALGRDVLLIAHSAYAFDDFSQRGEEAGFDHFLRKPCDAEELARLVRQALLEGHAEQPGE